MTERQGRLWWVEWLRVFGCVAVVLIHCFATLLDNATVAEIGLTRALVWTEVLVICCRWAVPAFLMVTGALLLDPAHEIGLPKVRGYVGRMTGVLLTFGTLFALMELVFAARSFSLAMLPEALLDVLQGRGWAHMWYIYDLLGVYLLLPVLRAFSSGSDERSYDIVLCVLFVLSLVENGYTNVDYLTADKSGTYRGLAQNKVAFAFQSNLTMAEVKKLNPDANVSMMEIPGYSADDSSFLISGERDAVGVWKDSENLDAALVFIDYLAQPENVLLVAEAYSLPPSMDNAEVTDPGILSILDQIDGSTVTNHFDRQYLPDGMWNTLKVYSTSVLSGESTVSEGSELMRTEYERLKN